MHGSGVVVAHGQFSGRTQDPSALRTYPSIQKHPATQTVAQVPPDGLSHVLGQLVPHNWYSSNGFVHSARSIE